MAEKTITIADFLTNEEITEAAKLYKRCRDEHNDHRFARLCKDEIISPNLHRIERALGQEMDAMYLAYAVQYVMDRSLSHG